MPLLPSPGSMKENVEIFKCAVRCRDTEGVCPSFLMVAVTKYPQEDQFRRGGGYVAHNLKLQSISAGSSGVRAWGSCSHHITVHYRERMDACLLTCILACSQTEISNRIQVRIPCPGNGDSQSGSLGLLTSIYLSIYLFLCFQDRFLRVALATLELTL